MKFIVRIVFQGIWLPVSNPKGTPKKWHYAMVECYLHLLCYNYVHKLNWWRTLLLATFLASIVLWIKGKVMEAYLMTTWNNFENEENWIKGWKFEEITWISPRTSWILLECQEHHLPHAHKLALLSLNFYLWWVFGVNSSLKRSLLYRTKLVVDENGSKGSPKYNVVNKGLPPSLREV